MKVSAAIVTVTIYVALFHGAVESSVSQCFSCLQTCMEPLIKEACPDSGAVDYKCLSSKIETGTVTHFSFNTYQWVKIICAGGDVQEVKGCVLANNTAVIEYCETINEQDGSSCFMCDTDLCNSTGISSVSVLLPSCLVFFITKVFEWRRVPNVWICLQ